MSALILFACIGYLIAVLWIDLIFDSLVLPHKNTNEPLPEEVLATMASFFKRLTLKPRLIFVVMITMLTIVILQIVQGTVPAWVAWGSLILVTVPTGYATARVMPAARRLGSRVDGPEKQSELARSLFAMHAFSLSLMTLLMLIQLYAASLR
jgi:hypothetical protein